MKRILAACALGCVLFAGVAQAKVLVVVDQTTDASGYGPGVYADIESPGRRQLWAMRALLDRFGADYKVLSPTIAKTEFCRTGVVTYNLGTAGAYTESFDAVIHLAFNGNATSAYTGYRPDSLTLTAKAPTVPQLMVLEENLAVAALDTNFPKNTTTDSTGLTASSPIRSPGGGSGNHEGEGTSFVVGNEALRWFEQTYGYQYMNKSTTITGGYRPLLANGMNSLFATSEQTAYPTQNPDSVGVSNPDTMLVWEKLNSHKAGAARIVFCSFGTVGNVDSASTAGPSTVNVDAGVNWTSLLCAVAHLDSLAGGAVLGSKKRPGIGFVITHGGGRSARNHPGGIFSADTTFLAESADSVRMAGVPVVIAADPESLAVNAGDIAILKRFGGRFTPFVRAGLDTSITWSGASTSLLPRDVWGWNRNRTFYGDSLVHAVAGNDTSLTALLYRARINLGALVGNDRLSATAIAPNFDFSPKQMRVNQNHQQLDSLMWAVRKARFTTLVGLSVGRDMDPQYNTTRPNGWLNSERTHTITTSSLKGDKVRLLMAVQKAVVGSSKFLAPSTADTIPPYCDVSCPAANYAVQFENRFWNGFFPLNGRDYYVTPYDNFNTGSLDGVVADFRQNIYGQKRSSVAVIPMQWFGGGGIDRGIGHENLSTTYPGRNGWLVIKHISNVVKAANYFAGRNIINMQYPEDIEP